MLRKALRTSLVTLAAVGLMVLGMVAALAHTEVGASAIADLVDRSSTGMLLLSFLVLCAAYPFFALRWRVLLPDPGRATVPGMTAIFCAGLLMNFAVPGPMGELGASWFVHRRYRTPLLVALATSMAARIIGLASAALIAAAVWGVADLRVPAEHRDIVTTSGVFTMVAAVALLVLAGLPGWWKVLAWHTLGRWSRPTGIRRLLGRVHGLVVQVVEAVASVTERGLRAPATSLFWSLCAHLVVCGSLVLLARSLGVPVGVPGLTFTYAASTAAAVLMFVFPGSQIAWDALFLGLLVATTGLGLPDAMAITLLVRVQQLGVMALGSLALAWLVASSPQPEA